MKILFASRFLLNGSILAVFLLVWFVSCPETLAQNSKPQKRVLVISIDGLDTRYLHDADKLGVKIPTLRRLMSNGVTAKGMRSVYPSITYPNHTTLVTGALPAKHGIFGNNVFESPSGEKTGAGIWFAKDIKADTLWDAAKRNGLTTGLVSYPVAGGAGDWNVPEIWKPGEGIESAKQAIRENAVPKEFVEEVEAKFPNLYENYSEDEGDDTRTKFAEYIITEKKPNLMLVHLFDLDHLEHDFGPFTPESFTILEKVDGYVARLLAAYERAGMLDETTVFITSDHGFKPINKQINPGVLLRKAGLIEAIDETQKDGKLRTIIKDWKAAVYVTGAACAIYLKDENDKAALKKLTEIFKPLEGKNDSGIYKILERKDIGKIGSNTRAAIMIDAGEGYTCGGNYSGEFITDTKTRGMHGYLPSRPDYHASFIASGANVKRRGIVDYIDMTDAGVIIANMLGVELKDASGKSIRLNIENKTR